MRGPAHLKTTRERVLDLLVPLGSPMHAWLQDLLTWLDDATRARELGTRPNPLYRERVLDLLHAAEPTACLAAALVHVEMLEAELAVLTFADEQEARACHRARCENTRARATEEWATYGRAHASRLPLLDEGTAGE